jgi:hypothetical protein
MPLFVIGLFSGGQKLGEGYGSSLKMAEWRAAEDSLRRIYLSRAFATSSALVDLHADPPLPSDTLAFPSTTYMPRPLGDDEVEYGRAQTPFQSAREARASPFRANLDPPHRVSHAPTPRLPPHLRLPKRPLTGPGSRDPSLPLEHRLPHWLWANQAGGPPGHRQSGKPDEYIRPTRTKIESPYNGPFEKPTLPKDVPKKVAEDLPAF